MTSHEPADTLGRNETRIRKRGVPIGLALLMLATLFLSTASTSAQTPQVLGPPADSALFLIGKNPTLPSFNSASTTTLTNGLFIGATATSNGLAFRNLITTCAQDGTDRNLLASLTLARSGLSAGEVRDINVKSTFYPAPSYGASLYNEAPPTYQESQILSYSAGPTGTIAQTNPFTLSFRPAMMPSGVYEIAFSERVSGGSFSQLAVFPVTVTTMDCSLILPEVLCMGLQNDHSTALLTSSNGNATRQWDGTSTWRWKPDRIVPQFVCETTAVQIGGIGAFLPYGPDTGTFTATFNKTLSGDMACHRLDSFWHFDSWHHGSGKVEWKLISADWLGAWTIAVGPYGLYQIGNSKMSTNLPDTVTGTGTWAEGTFGSNPTEWQDRIECNADLDGGMARADVAATTEYSLSSADVAGQGSASVCVLGICANAPMGSTAVNLKNPVQFTASFSSSTGNLNGDMHGLAAVSVCIPAVTCLPPNGVRNYT